MMTLGRTSLSLMLAAHIAFGTVAAFAQETDEQGYEIEHKGRAPATRRGRETARPQGSDTYTVTSRRTYDGGYTTRDSDGYSVSGRRTYDGGYTTRDSDGYSVTTRRTYDGGYITKDNEGYSESCRPTYNGHTCRRTMPRDGQ